MQFSTDTHLIAAVQKFSGAQCHRAANLVNRYMFAVELCRQVSGDGEIPDDEAVRILEDSESSLRRFLCECRWSQRAYCA